MLSISEITKTLRVPELKYRVSNRDESGDLVTLICDYLKEQAGLDTHDSLVKSVENESFNLTPRIYNLLFFYDRLFDVFSRKANMDEAVKDRLSRWRFSLAILSIKNPQMLDDSGSTVVRLLDTIIEGVSGWSQEPKRVASVLLNRLDKVNGSLLSLDKPTPELIESLLESWVVEQTKQQQRLDQLFSRLLLTEQGAATSRYATINSRLTVKKLTTNKPLPQVVNEFLCNGWLEVLRQSLLNRNPECGWHELEALTQDIVSLFSPVAPSKLQALFEGASDLVDRLAVTASKFEVSIESSQWESLQQQLIATLQGDEVDREPLEIDLEMTMSEALSETSMNDINKKIGQWFFVDSNESVSRSKFAHFFEDSKEVLWLNHAGMKSSIMSYNDVIQGVNNGTIKAITQCISFAQVLNDTVKGLGKVAQVQMVSRKKARLKAEAEAEQLRVEKQTALEDAQRKETAAAQRLLEQKLEEEEKIRLELEQEMLKVISTLTLGAWVSIMVDGVGEKYKLVVRINASDKFIFVDKHGLKKVEIKTPDLVARLIAKEIKVLSGGVEFDDTLSRVVGRMRVSQGG